MCAYCPFVCVNVTEVREHSSVHDNKLDLFDREIRHSFPLRIDITNLACSGCDERVSSLNDLKKHLFEAHPESVQHYKSDCGDGVVPFILTGTEYKCVHCGKLARNFMNLTLHMNSHYQDFVCHTCGKAFSGQHKLRLHQKSHEFGKFPCSKCELVFENTAAKNRHLTLVHGPKERHRCPVCDSHFDSYHARLRHMEREHGLKTEYKCNLCSAVFSTGSNRTSHLRRVHKLIKKAKAIVD